MQLVNLFVYPSSLSNSSDQNYRPIDDIFALMQIYFPRLPSYPSCPRTELGRPFLKEKVDSLCLTSARSSLLSMWQDFCATFALNHHKSYTLVDFNITNSRDILCGSFLLQEKQQDEHQNPIPTIGIDLEFLSRKLPNRKVFSQKILNQKDLWADTIVNFEDANKNKLDSLISCLDQSRYRYATLITWGIKEAVIKAHGSSIFQGKNIALTHQGIQVDGSLQRYTPHQPHGDASFLVHSPSKYQLQHFLLNFANTQRLQECENLQDKQVSELLSCCLYVPQNCSWEQIHATSAEKLHFHLQSYADQGSTLELSKIFTNIPTGQRGKLSEMDLDSINTLKLSCDSSHPLQIISQHYL